MTREEFKELVGKNIIVDYKFGNEIQQWNMMHFYINKKGEIKHRIIKTLIIDVFIKNAYNPRPAN